MLTAYVWAAGPEFDAERFAHRHEGEGSLRQTRVMRGGEAVVGLAEWESRRFPVPEHVPSDEIIPELLGRYGPLIADAKRAGATEVFLQFVGRFVDRDAKGLYLSPELMRTLAEHGVSVDYDIVRTAQTA